MFGFHLTMIFLMVFFICAVFILSKALMRKKRNALILALMIYIIAFNTSNNRTVEKEFFYWYTGAINYGLVFALSCITLALSLWVMREENSKKIRYLVVTSVITGICASGGSLEVTSFNCSWLLLVLILEYQKIKQRKMMIVPFAASFAGALVNACAIGNFVRSDLTNGESSYGLTDALCDTLLCWKREGGVVFQNKFFVLLLVIAFVVSLVLEFQIFTSKISTGKMLVLVPAIFAIQYFTAFPVVLGYQKAELIYSRTIYTYELLVKLTSLFFIIVFAQWIRERAKNVLPVVCGGAIALGLFLILTNDISACVSDGYSYKVLLELRDGNIQEVCEFRENVLECLQRQEQGTNVYMQFPNVPSSKVMYGMGITEHTESNCNVAAASYFGFDSLSVVYSDEYEFPEF